MYNGVAFQDRFYYTSIVTYNGLWSHSLYIPLQMEPHFFLAADVLKLPQVISRPNHRGSWNIRQYGHVIPGCDSLYIKHSLLRPPYLSTNRGHIEEVVSGGSKYVDSSCTKDLWPRVATKRGTTVHYNAIITNQVTHWISRYSVPSIL